MRLPDRLGPVELGLLEGRGQGRVGDVLAGGLVAEFRELGEFPASPLAHRICETRLEIAEEQEGSRATPFLAHEQQRDLRRQQHDRNAGMQCRVGRLRR